jgi:alpha-tubulin suppressor-like RCC1 family protein
MGSAPVRSSHRARAGPSNLADHRVVYWGVVYNGYAYGPSKVSPVEVPGFAGAVQISLGMNHACAVMSDHTVRCVGNNESGQLGDGSTQWSTTPITVSGLGPASKVAANYEYTRALLLDGTAWCWGFPGHITLGIVGLATS